jgi:hypothetical protein
MEEDRSPGGVRGRGEWALTVSFLTGASGEALTRAAKVAAETSLNMGAAL